MEEIYRMLEKGEIIRGVFVFLFLLYLNVYRDAER